MATSSTKSSNRKAIIHNPIGFGKIPPQAIELEEVVLGAIMLERDAFISVNEILRPEIFYTVAHQITFEAIQNLNSKAQPIDILTVTQGLRSMGKLEEVGGPFYITQLTNRVASAANIEMHARILTQEAMDRLIEDLAISKSEADADLSESQIEKFEFLAEYFEEDSNISA